MPAALFLDLVAKAARAPKLTPGQKAAQTKAAKRAAAEAERAAAAQAAASAAASRASASAKAAAEQPRVPAGQVGGGRFTAKDFTETLRRSGLPADDRAPHRMVITGNAPERAFAGQQVAIPRASVFGGPGRQHEVGDRAESLALAYVQQNVSPAAALLKQTGARNNLPFDMMAHVPGRGLVLYEVKGGQPSNTRSGWQWRITFDYQVTSTQAAKLTGKGKMTPEQLRQYQAQEAGRRKQAMVAELDRQMRAAGLLSEGEGVHVETVGVIFDANRQVTDIHIMPDVEERTGWTSERAARGYRGSFRFRVEKARRRDVVKEWGDALEAELMGMVPWLVGQARALIRAAEDPPMVEVRIEKVAPERRYFAGWASIIEKGGVPVVDHQNHTIDEPTLIAAADEFMRSHRVGKVMHQGDPDKVEYVESIVFTRDVQKAMGIDLGMVGWWVGGYAHDDATWKAIKGGRLKALSIGGKARIIDAE